MKPAMNLAILLVALGSPLLARGQTLDLWRVDLEQGSIEAPKTMTEGGTQYYAFKGIPFAQPPVGDLRFKNPVPAGPWTEVKNGSIPGPMCPQVDIIGFLSGEFKVAGEEDCLYLDVYVPKKTASEFSVMVWIHGGGFILGSAMEYNPIPLMKKDVIIVVIQYRLGALGYLSTEDSVMSGNYGLKDQVMALRWVQENIRAFGGDPNSVTIFGESAGGMSAHFLMLSPMSKGLFHRAIAQSGTALLPFMRTESPRYYATTVGQILECPTVNPENLDTHALYECLKKVPPEQFVNVASAFTVFMGMAPTVMVPTVDGEFFPEHPIDMLRKGNYQRVDFLTGITRDEGALQVRPLLLNEAAREEIATNISTIGPATLNVMAGPNASSAYIAKRMFAHYIGSFKITEDNADAAVKMYSDHVFAIPCDLTGQMHARDAAYGQKTFLYELHHNGEFSFMDSPNITVGKNWVAHADDVQYLFHTPYVVAPTRPTDLFMSEVMVDLWTNFARTGNPTPDMSLGFKWSPVSESDLRYLILQPSPYMKKIDREEDLEFMTNLPLDHFMRLFPERFAKDEK